MESGAKHPEFLRSTNLRKHIRVTAQVMNLKENELDVLASFLGHDLQVHRDFYWLPDSTMQIAKISKVLLRMEKGQIATLAGKTLDQIDIDEDEGNKIAITKYHVHNGSY